MVMKLSLRKCLSHGVLLGSVATFALSAGKSSALSINLLDPNLSTFTVTEGDFVYSGFSYSGFTANTNDRFTTSSIGDSATQFGLQFDPARATSVSGSFNYTISLLNYRSFDFANASYQGGRVGGTAPSFVTILNSSGLSISPAAGPSANPTVTSPDQTFNPFLTSQTFTQTFDYTAGTASALNSLNAQLVATPQGTTRTPGPLPLLGAGAAFGFSRKLRHRIKSAS